MANLDYRLTYGGIPFVNDDARAVRFSISGQEKALAKQQPESSLLDDLDRLFPFDWLQEFGYSQEYPGRTMGALAHLRRSYNEPGPRVKIGEYYYPTGASRWSYFRGLATSSAVKAMLSATGGGRSPATFKMNSEPVQPGKAGRTYGISTSLFMLPPRALGESAGQFDGLYLVTLVDERWRWQFAPVSFKIKHETTWASLITSLATALGVTVSYSALAGALTRPEPDSQLWSCEAPAALLLDAVALTLGRTVVRKYDGTYRLYKPEESLAIASGQRRDSGGRVVRSRGGDSFNSGTALPAGDLRTARESVLPSTVRMTFPKYVEGDDPIPHYLNPRGQATRHYEESYGETYAIDVPIRSGGAEFSGVQGVSGPGGVHVLRSTAKALYDTEEDAAGFSGPTNLSGLRALALDVAAGYWTGLGGDGLDESYLGILAWDPEGLHDLLFTFSKKDRLAATRVMRQEWNASIMDAQHGTPVVDAYHNVSPIGQQGPPPPLTVRDDVAEGEQSVLTDDVTSGDHYVAIDPSSGIDRPFKALIDREWMMLGPPAGGLCEIIARGIDGTVENNHAAGAILSGKAPHTSYLTNLVTFEAPLHVAMGSYTSGGVQEARVYMDPGSYVTTIGNGGDTIFVINHNLNSQNVVVVIRNSAAPFQVVLVDVDIFVTTVNTVTLVFAGAPTLGQYVVTVYLIAGSTGGDITYNVSNTIIYAGPTINYTANTTITISGGVTVTIVGGTTHFSNTTVNFTVVNSTWTSSIIVYTNCTFTYNNGAWTYNNVTWTWFNSIWTWWYGELTWYYSTWTWWGGNWYVRANWTWTIFSGVYWYVNGPGYLVISCGTKFYDGLWFHYREASLIADGVLNLPAFGNNRVCVKLDMLADRSLTGMIHTEDGGAGQVIWLFNDSAVFNLTIKDEDGTAAATRRFFCPGGRDFILTPFSNVMCWYDPALSRWRVHGDERVLVRKGSGSYVGPRNRLSFVEGSNVTITVADDNVNGEVDVTISASSSSGGGITNQSETFNASDVVVSGNYSDAVTAQLPDDGVYIFFGDVNASMTPSSVGPGDSIQFRIRNTTQNLTAGNTGQLCWIQTALGSVTESCESHGWAAYSSGDTIAVQGRYVATTTPAICKFNTARLTYILLE